MEDLETDARLELQDIGKGGKEERGGGHFVLSRDKRFTENRRKKIKPLS